MLQNKRGLAGYIVVIAALILWVVVVVIWYNSQPLPQLDLTDKKNMFIVVWWTLVCILCAFIGLRMEKARAM